MDLKLGNRNYDPSRHQLDKIRVRKLRLQSTTSGKLGVRISGLRVYRPRYNNYLTRSATSFGDHIHSEWHLKRAIKLFLHDGYRLRTELIPLFIDRLKKLLKAVKTQRTFDFLSSSVLLIYEGEIEKVKDSNVSRFTSVDVRLIDFDHASLKIHPTAEDTTGTTIGISTLIGIFRKILYSAKKIRSDSELQRTFVMPKIMRSPKGSHSEEED